MSFEQKRFDVSTSRNERRFRSQIILSEEQHSIILSSIASVESDLRRIQFTPDNEAGEYDHACADASSGRQFMLSSLFAFDQLAGLSLQFYGGNDNPDAQRLDYIPGFHQFQLTERYSHNTKDVDAASGLKIISDNTDLDLGPYLDQAVEPKTVQDIALLLQSRAKNTPEATSTGVQKYTNYGLSGTNTDLLVTKINGHTRQYVVDTYTASQNQGSKTTQALNYQVNVESYGQPMALVLREITTNDPVVTSASVPKQYDPETAHMAIIGAVESLRPIPASSRRL